MPTQPLLPEPTDPTVRAGVLDDAAGLLRVPLSHLLAVADPLRDDPWGVGAIDVAELLSPEQPAHRHGPHPDFDPSASMDGASAAQGFARLPEGVLSRRIERMECRGCHIERVRFLAWHGWARSGSDDHPVTIDVGLDDGPPRWHPLVDGNHRVAAATLRGDHLIDVSVGGDWDLACSLLLDGDPWP